MSMSSVLQQFVSIMKIIQKFRSITLLVFLGILLKGCMVQDEALNVPVPISYISIYNAASGFPGLDVLIDNEKANPQTFTYTGYYRYTGIAAGNRNLKFTPHAANDILVDTTLHLVENKVYSLFLTVGDNVITPFVTEDVWAEPTSGKAMIRLINLSPDAPAMDLYVGDKIVSLFPNQVFKSVSAFKEIEAGNEKLILKTSGESIVVADLQDVEIESKGIYTIIVRGFVAPPDANSNSIELQLVTNHTIL